MDRLTEFVSKSFDRGRKSPLESVVEDPMASENSPSKEQLSAAVVEGGSGSSPCSSVVHPAVGMTEECTSGDGSVRSTNSFPKHHLPLSTDVTSVLKNCLPLSSDININVTDIDSDQEPDSLDDINRLSSCSSDIAVTRKTTVISHALPRVSQVEPAVSAGHDLTHSQTTHDIDLHRGHDLSIQSSTILDHKSKPR